MIERNMVLAIAVAVLAIAIMLAAVTMNGQPVCCDCAYDEQDVLRCR